MLGGRGSVLFLSGEAGLGKTTLVHEWSKTIENDGAVFAEAACSIPIAGMQVGLIEALQPWADVVVGLHQDEHTAKKKLDIHKLIHDSAPAWAWALPLVGDLAHAAFETSRLIREQRSEASHNPNAANQEQVFQQYVNLLTNIAAQQPLVILLDDAHWSDTSSVNLLFYISRQIKEKKIFILVTYRPDDAMIGDNGQGHPILRVKSEIIRYETGGELALHYMDDAAIRTMLGASFPGYKTDTGLEQWLAKISDGNSLFITQFLTTLREDGHLTEKGEFVGNYNTVAIPSSVLAVVEERTRRLNKDIRDLLSYATAEGEEFTTYVLSKLGNREPLKLLHELRDATQKHIIVEKGRARSFANQTTTVFGFSHALFHKVLYEQLMEEERAILHRQCYEILRAEWQNAEEKGEHPASLASKLLIHAEKCEEWETACNIALKAANDAWRSYASEETNEMLEKCLANAAHLSRNAALLKIKSLLLRSEMESHQARFETALNTLREIHALCAEIHEEDFDVRATINEAITLNRLGKYVESLHLLDEVLRQARANGASSTAARALRFMGANHYRLGDYQRAMDCYQETATITKQNSGCEEAADLGYIGETYRMLGDYDKALEYSSRALDLARQGNDRVSMCYQFGNIGLVYYALGKYAQMKEYFEQGLAIAEAIGNRAEQTAMLGRLGLAYHAMADNTNALKYFEQSLVLAKETNDKLREAEQLNNIGAIYSELKDHSQALEYLHRSLAIKEEIGSRAGQASTLINIGDNHTLSGEYTQALEYYNRSLEITNAIGNRNLRIIGYTNGACAYRLHGNLEQARKWLEDAKQILQEHDDPSTKAEFLRESSMLEEAVAIAKGNDEREKHIKLACEYMGQAKNIFEEINHWPKAEKCAAEIARINNNYKF